ncbi:MAG: carboxylesterase [Marmoricola sp.]|nr:carboxylesterase [Marmoricola sp.]
MNRLPALAADLAANLVANLGADVRARLIQASAKRTVRYGDALRFSGTDLPEPTLLHVPTRHGKVRCEVYQPPLTGATPPAYVHFHGGAFLMRFPRMDDFFARIVAAEVGAVVVNVDYDVAPQRRFPVAQHQAHDVAAWVVAHADDLGIDGNRVGVGGFSAGGNLAASACLQARDLDSFRPASQLLGVPSLDIAEDPALKSSPITRPMINAGLLALVRRSYFRDIAARSTPYASPLRAPQVAGLPPTIIVTAEYDVLRTEGDRYAARLDAAGIPVLHHVVAGADHYFLDNGPIRARATLDLIVNGLKGHLGTASR